MIHGLSSSKFTLYPLMQYLKSKGFENFDMISYDTEQEFEECVISVNEKIEANYEDPIIVIGQSYGGLIANKLHEHRNILLGLYIVSPFNGSKTLNKINKLAPYFTSSISHTYILNKDRELPPPHDYFTYSTSFPLLDSDICVNIDDTIIDNVFHRHIPCNIHQTIFLDPRLFKKVYEDIKNKINLLVD